MSEIQVCPRCGRENEADATNCVRCGIDLSEGWETGPSEPEAPSAYCFKHPKVATNLSCGRCERPICTKCAVIGANGVRCRECAKHNVAMRPGAVVHEVKRGLFSILRLGPWGIWILITVIGSIFWMVRAGCTGPAEHQEPPPVESGP
jgi:hypothetical protein